MPNACAYRGCKHKTLLLRCKVTDFSADRTKELSDFFYLMHHVMSVIFEFDKSEFAE